MCIYLGRDFNEFFSPITWMESIQAMLVVEAIEDYKVHKMDVKTIFLNEGFSNENYMQQP